ncbi:MAG: Rid family detoxifying hydrolase [Acidobacteriota bacterium]|nr:Rid family detoxifying hydrolase [Acidobacteriota bacterium]
MKEILIGLAITFAAFQISSAQSLNRSTANSKIEQELLKANREYDAAIVANDANALDKILADDFVYTNPDGEVRDKARQLAFARSGELKFETGTSDDVKIRIYGNTAVMTGRFTAKGQFKDKSMEINERYTAVWIKQNGRWRLVAEQGNFIKQQSKDGEKNSLVNYYTAEERKNLNRPYSDAVRVGNTLYLAGAIGTMRGTNQLAPGGIEAETRQTLENIKQTLEANGSSMNDVVRCTVMLADIAEWDKMNSVYRTYFPNNRPARSSLGVNGLVLNARVEIECTAVVH